MTRLLATLLLAVAAAPVAVAAQGVVQPVPGTTDADRLAAQMRILGGDANDLPALLTAGELSVKLDDLGAAASFFARADKVDPRNGRAKAGEGAILVHAERPGEALRYFAMAESYGLAPAAFASDRGLAYDLIGEQDRAQRDYRLALRTPSAAEPDETQRRYALSLAIAGKRELADQQLQPLLRHADRGAWRVHAFVLAMGGNVAEASRIATTMMPPGTAAGLLPFLERLPTLGPVDRAFAVHFGETRSTPQRVADAKLAPALAALGPDPYAPRVAVALAAPPVAKDKRRGKGKRQVALASPAPEPLPQAPRYRAQPGAAPVVATRGSAPAAWPTAIAPGVRPAVQPTVTLAASPGFSTAASAAPATSPIARSTPPPPAVAIVARPTLPQPPVTRAIVTPAASVPPPETKVIIAFVAPAPLVALPAPAPPAPAVPMTVAAVPSTPEPTASTPAAWPTPITPETPRPPLMAVAPVEPRTTVVQRRRDDATLSRIVAGLPIPAAELGVVKPAIPAAPAPAAAIDQAAADRAAAAKALADKRAADRKAAAEKKALAEKKAAAEKKAEEAREAAAQKKLERANPERVWVQVAGGAYAADLPKAWAAVRTKYADAFAGHTTGWTTPLRATNRVLAGPFKSGEDARAFVNLLKGKGFSTFTFTSDAGQVVTKLPAK